VALFPRQTVSRNKPLHEAQVKLLQRVTRRRAQASAASLQLWPHIGNPDAANYSEFRTQLCGRTAWMCFQKVFHVFSEHRRQFLGLERDHIQKTHAHTFLDCQTLRSRSGRRTHNWRFTEPLWNDGQNVVATSVSDAVTTWDLAAAPNHRDRSR